MAVGASGMEGSTLMYDNNVPLLGHEGPFGTSSSESLQELSSNGITMTSDSKSNIAGGQAICVMREPSFSEFKQGMRGQDHYLDIRLEGNEWGALFLDVLRVPGFNDVPRLKDEESVDWQERYRSIFQRTLPNNPMLARIWDIFIYVSFEPEEIEDLRKECLRIQSTTSNKRAQEALAKLIHACDKAGEVQSGLFFVPD